MNEREIIDKFQNLLYDGKILEAYDCLSKNLNDLSGRYMEIILKLFHEEMLLKSSNMNILIKHNEKWFEKIDRRYLTDDIKSKFEMAILVSGVFYKANSDIIRGRLSTQSVNIDSEFKYYAVDEKYKKYGHTLYDKLMKQDDRISIWIVSNNIGYEKKIDIEFTRGTDINDLRVGFVNTHLKDDFKSIVKQAFGLIKMKIDFSDTIGIKVGVDGINDMDEIGGRSAGLAVYVAILQKLKDSHIIQLKDNIDSNTAYIADIDIIKKKLRPVDDHGLELKIKKAIKNNYKRVVIAHENYPAAMRFHKDIEIVTFESIFDLIDIRKNIIIRDDYQKKDFRVEPAEKEDNTMKIIGAGVAGLAVGAATMFFNYKKMQNDRKRK